MSDTWIKPPLPQNDDKRVFAVGARVSADMTFSQGCPPGPNKILKGTLGTVVGEPVQRDDRPFRETIRMIPVRWDGGATGEVVDSLLRLQQVSPQQAAPQSPQLSRQTPTSELGEWYKCKGCGQLIGFFPNGLKSPRGDSDLPRGAVMHVKPAALVGVPNSVRCDLYRRFDAVSLYILHQGAERQEPPDSLEPI